MVTQNSQTLPSQTPNNSSPLTSGELTLAGELKDSLGKPVTGALTLTSYVTAAWRYLFGTFAQTSVKINPNWTTSVSNPPTQAQVQAIVVQVELLSAQLGKLANLK